jgi:hypothetical protein
MMVWTYVITHDAGAAPNFDGGFTTLTVCKPRIRKSAQRGDIVLAFNGKKLNPYEPHSVRWAGIVTEVIPLNDYWDDQRFQGKKPGQSRTPDNIYRPASDGRFKQVINNTHRPADYARDVNGLNALVLKPSWYFGPTVAVLPANLNLRMIGGRRGHRCSPINSHTWRKLEKWLRSNAAVTRAANNSIGKDVC